MGLDLWIEKSPCQTCGHEIEGLSFHCTYNLSPMWYKAVPEAEKMVGIEGMTGKEAYPFLLKAKDALLSDPESFIFLNPPNGFGSYSGLIDFIEKLLITCIDNPDLIWKACR